MAEPEVDDRDVVVVVLSAEVLPLDLFHQVIVGVNVLPSLPEYYAHGALPFVHEQERPSEVNPVMPSVAEARGGVRQLDWQPVQHHGRYCVTAEPEQPGESSAYCSVGC